MKQEKIRRCKCICNKELPSRYKGRAREFYSPECRKVFNNITLTKKEQERYSSM
jgi:hypothetical protein